MLVAAVHVSNRPLSGEWDGKHWDAQASRCSNDFLAGPTPPVPPVGAASGLIWSVSGLPDPTLVSFNVSVDLQNDDDEVLFTAVRHNQQTSFLPVPSVTGDPDGHKMHNSTPWEQYYKSGIYIADVQGAETPFTIDVLGADKQDGGASTGASVVGTLNIWGGSGPITIIITGTGAPLTVADEIAGPGRNA